MAEDDAQRTVPVPVEELERLYELLEEMNQLLHQPLSYRDPEVMERFAEAHYPTLKALYYDVVWDWLPEDVKKRYEER